MTKLIRNIVITLLIGVAWILWIYYSCPQLDSKNTKLATGVCVSVESHTSWHGRFGAHTTSYVLELDNGTRYFVTGKNLKKDLREKIDDGVELNIKYIKNRHKFTLDAKRAVEIQAGDDLFLTLDDSNQANRNTRIAAWIIWGVILSIVLYISIIQIEKAKRKSYIKIVLNKSENAEFLTKLKIHLDNHKWSLEHEILGHTKIYLERRILTTNCYVCIDINLLNTEELNDIKQFTVETLRKRGCIFANIFYIIVVETSSGCFKKAMRNYVKQKYNRKTYYIGMVRSNNTLFLPNSNKREIQQIKAYVCSQL